jgi:hypothetical protein
MKGRRVEGEKLRISKASKPHLQANSNGYMTIDILIYLLQLRFI